MISEILWLNIKKDGLLLWGPQQASQPSLAVFLIHPNQIVVQKSESDPPAVPASPSVCNSSHSTVASILKLSPLSINVHFIKEHYKDKTAGTNIGCWLPASVEQSAVRRWRLPARPIEIVLVWIAGGASYYGELCSSSFQTLLQPRLLWNLLTGFTFL